jgi:hypothetical protein
VILTSNAQKTYASSSAVAVSILGRSQAQRRRLTDRDAAGA